MDDVEKMIKEMEENAKLGEIATDPDIPPQTPGPIDGD